MNSPTTLRFESPVTTMEVSRRIMSLQRPKFMMLGAAAMLAGKDMRHIRMNNGTASVDLVSHYDGVEVNAYEAFANKSERMLDRVLKLGELGTLSKYMSIQLGDVIAVPMDSRNTIIAAKITDSQYSLVEERTVLAKSMDVLMQDVGGLWEPVEPVLRLGVYSGSPDAAQDVMGYIAEHLPAETELFDASVRF